MIDVPIEVKEILQDGRHTKNFRFNVLKDDGTVDFVIDNNTLVSETVNFDERMCSGDTLKFGLCEGSSLEFQYFDHPNINGRQIQCFIDIEYGDDQTCSIPMGYFTVAKCSRQASTGIIKVTAYNKLQSDYLDQKANDNLKSLFISDPTLKIIDIKNALLGHYQIIEKGTGTASSSVQPVTSFLDFPGFYLRKMYGVDSVINGYELRNTVESPADPFTIYLYAQTNRWYFPSYDPLTPGPKMADAIHGLLLDLEQNYVNYLKKLIDDAYVDNQETQGLFTGDDFIDLICENWGFQQVFSIYRSTSGYSSSTVYSTVQYDYEERKGIAHTVAGRLQDVTVLLDDGQPQYYEVVAPSEIVIEDYSLNLNGIIDGIRDHYEYYTDSSKTTTTRSKTTYLTYSDGTKYDINNKYPILVYRYPDLAGMDSLTYKPSTIPDFTLRELLTATFEVDCQFGKLDRITDVFSGVELNGSRLFPANNLYPDNSLYPDGAAVSSHKSMYSKLWGDEGNIQKWRYLIITYKTLVNNQEKEVTLQRTVNSDGTVDYNMSDNWMFKNRTWTAVQVGTYADAMVAKMQNVTWFPFEMWCAGLPYLETGDEIEVSIGESTYTTYILQRQLKGIQNLQDTYINGTLDIF